MKKQCTYLLLGASLLMTGCAGFISVDPPGSALVEDQVFERDVTANAAMTAVYASMVADVLPFLLPAYTGLYGDELTLPYTYATLEKFRSNALEPVTNSGSAVWNNAYKYIYQCNAVLEGCTASQKLSPSVRTLLMAEARFTRAFWHFILVNIYGDVPICTTTDYRVNMDLPRSPVHDVYTQIVGDLQYAMEKLPAEYVDGIGQPGAIERVRPNKWAAAALLARAHLYTQEYNMAGEMAAAVIGHTALYDTVAVHQVFLKNNREAIWQLMPSTANPTINTQEGLNFVPVPGLAPIKGALTNSLYAAFDPADRRRAQWLKSYTGPGSGGTYYYPYKYKVREGSPVVEYSTVLRLAEQYLIRAEARVRQNNPAGAVADLNVVRKRAGLPNIAPGTADVLMAAILQERRRELFCEYGHRWFDLKRTGSADAVMAAHAVTKGVVWEPYKKWWPIAKSELDKNRNLTQNQGYQQ